jgi:hypothetical protein
MKRRDFLKNSVLVGAGLAASPMKLAAASPEVMKENGLRPVVISSANGNWFKNGGNTNLRRSG